MLVRYPKSPISGIAVLFLRPPFTCRQIIQRVGDFQWAAGEVWFAVGGLDHRAVIRAAGADHGG